MHSIVDEMEAEDLTAEDFGDVKSPPFPCFERFILESTTIAGVEPVVDRPLLYVQVRSTLSLLVRSD